jgi:hypothetical protein
MKVKLRGTFIALVVSEVTVAWNAFYSVIAGWECCNTGPCGESVLWG